MAKSGNHDYPDFLCVIPHLHFKCTPLLQVYNKIVDLQHIKCIKENLSCLISNSGRCSWKAHNAWWSDKRLFGLIRCGVWNFWNVVTFCTCNYSFVVRLSVTGAFYMINTPKKMEIVTVCYGKSQIFNKIHINPLKHTLRAEGAILWLL